MRYWYDTEFHEDGRIIDLISIGIVAEDGREYYAISKEFNRDYAIEKNPWLVENVFPHLPTDPKNSRWKYRPEIRDELLEFMDPEKYGKPELWAYYADYDHVALCQLFGRMIDLPKGWPMYTRDIKQLHVMVGKPLLPAPPVGEHDALVDAHWNEKAWYLLWRHLDKNGVEESFMPWFMDSAPE